MDRKSQLVIVALVVVALVFFMGLGTSLVPKSNENSDPRKDKGFTPPAWAKGMGSITSRFAPSLDQARVSTNCGGPPSKEYILNKSRASCSFSIKRIPNDAGDDYQNAKLRLKGQGARVQIKYNDDEMDWPPKQPENRDEPVGLTILKEGGTITLRCTNCPQGRAVSVSLE